MQEGLLIKNSSCTADEVRALLEKTIRLNIAQFKESFEKKYGRNPVHDENLSNNLEELSKSMLFTASKKEGSYYLSLPES